MKSKFKTEEEGFFMLIRFRFLFQYGKNKLFPEKGWIN